MYPNHNRPALALLALALCAGPAFAQQDESGADDQLAPAGRSRIVPEGLDDAFQPLLPAAAPTTPRGDQREDRLAPAAGPSVPLWQLLKDLSEEDKANAVLDFEFGRDATEPQRQAAGEIAALWDQGLYDEAIELLRDLEEGGAPLAMGIAWKTPRRGPNLRALDVRIGGTRTGARTMALDYDVATGNLLAVVLWGGTTGSSAWTVNLSTDGGATWSETYTWNSSVGIIDVDATAVAGYLYVAYVVGNDTSIGRLRRMFGNTGAVDATYGFHSIIDAGVNTIEEVALAANPDDFDNRIYYLAIQDNDVLRYAWDEAADATTFTDESPGSSNPEFGLDATYDNNLSCTPFVWVSYAGNDGNIHVMAKDETNWTDYTVESAAGSFRRTAISAYDQTIICAFEYPFSNGTGIRYRISYNCGGTWSPGSLAIPDGSSVFAYFEPDVDARNGNGTAIVYQAEVGEPDPVFYRTREGFAPGAWSDPTQFNDFDVVTGSETTIGHIPPLATETFSHGAMYISNDPNSGVVYFDRPSGGAAPCDDTTPPLVEITSPAALGCACDLVDIVGSVSDPDGTYAGDELQYRRRGDAAWTTADTASGARSGVLYTLDMSALPQDFYYIRVVARNECGLTASDTVFVYHSTSFGNAELRAPANGLVYGGTVCFDGTAWTQSCFDHYTVDYRPAGGGPWNPVDPPNSPYTSHVLNDPLASWNTTSGPSAVPDGDFDVRLRAVTDCNDVAEIIHTITVDNTPPVAEITDPIPCEYVTGIVEVFGTALDTNISGWVLQYTGGDSSGWVTINSGTTNVVNGSLGRWDTTGLRPCAYTLRLVVWDQARLNCTSNTHRTEYTVSVNVGCPTDINGDGVTDLSDLSALLQLFGTVCQ